MERQEIEIFLALAEELHFGRTAERVGVSQGRVSQTIARLERRIGARLFDRTSRRVALTAIGERLNAGIAPAYRTIQEEIARATAAAQGITGVLRIGFSAPFTGHLLLKVAEEFCEIHPEVQVEVQAVPLSDPFGALRGEAIDFQVTETPVREPDITTGPVLVAEPRMLFVPTSHHFAGRSSVSLEDLGETTMLTVGGPVPGYWVDYHVPRQTPSGRPVPRGPAIMHWEDALALVRMGKGIVPVAEAGAREHARPGLTAVPLRDAPPFEYAALWLTHRANPLARAFVAMAHHFTTTAGGPSRVGAALQ